MGFPGKWNKPHLNQRIALYFVSKPTKKDTYAHSQFETRRDNSIPRAPGHSSTAARASAQQVCRSAGRARAEVDSSSSKAWETWPWLSKPLWDPILGLFGAPPILEAILVVGLNRMFTGG